MALSLHDAWGARPPDPHNRINTPYRALIITLLDRHKPAYVATYCHGNVPVGGQVGRSAGLQVGTNLNIWLGIRPRWCLPGMQEIRGSIPGRGTTDFCTLILFVYIISCIVLFFVSYILIPDAVERL